MSQAEVTKLTQEVAIGSDPGSISVAKLTMYVILQPGDGADDTSNKQGHVQAQILRRD